MIDLKIISPKNLLNFCSYLIEQNCFEEAFRVYEKGLGLFKWPSLTAIWLNYINAIETRFQDKKVERLRDLYERVLQEAPEDKSKDFLA
jgi:pre-mRNA-splicing factor SYF1